MNGLRVASTLLLALACCLASACTKRPSDTGSEDKSSKSLDDPWPRLVTGLRKETDPATCRRLLNQVSSDIAQLGKPELQPEFATPEQLTALKSLLNLTDDQLKELQPSNYSALDAHYLAECFYLRDAARSLEADGLPPRQQAELAFEWVCRQVVLSPTQRVNPNGSVVPFPPLPPTYVLRRGSGSGLERAYVFISLVQQLNLDACLIGPASAAERPWNDSPSANSNEYPRGPFWAVGVKLGGELALFDPWRGEPFPGSLKELQAKPDLLKPWIDDKTKPWPGTVEMLKDAVPTLAYPINAAAPRMKRLEQELRNVGGVRLVQDPSTLKAKFEKDLGMTLRFWTAPDLFALPRVLAGFLPREEGGLAPDASLSTGYLFGSLPLDLVRIRFAQQIPQQYVGVLKPFLPTPQDPVGLPEVITRLVDFALAEFDNSFSKPPLPRELIQRGQFFEVAPRLTKTREKFIQAQNRIRTDKRRDELLTEWANKARELYLSVSAARSRKDALAQANAERLVEEHWKTGQETVSSVVDVFLAETGLAEATYLLAMSTHEQAERAVTRYLRLKEDGKTGSALQKARESAYNTCEESVGWWDKYKPFAAEQAARFPGRAEHAVRLAERVAKLAAQYKP